MSDDTDMRETARHEYEPPELRVLTPKEVDDLVGGVQDLPDRGPVGARFARIVRNAPRSLFI